MIADKILVLAAVVFGGVLCQWGAWRIKMPAILFLLVAGILAGPVFNLLDSDALFGDLLFPFISLSVAVILFEGSLTLKYHQIVRLRGVVQSLVSVGVVTTWLITATVTRYALDFPWSLALLFGAITVVTGPTVIVPMLRTIRPKASVANILRWEGIVIDPIGATLAVLVYEFILAGSNGRAFGHTLVSFAMLLSVGLLLGSLAGYLYGLVLRSHWLPEYLHNVATLALVFMVFAFANHLQHESGLLAVTVMGIWLANMKDVPVDEILDFKESLSVLLITVLFIVLAARLDADLFLSLGWRAIFVFLAIQFLARPLSVMVASLGSGLSWPERHLLAWIAPRGIVAAAISAFFAIKLEETGYSQAGLLVPLTFLVIIGTVVLQSATAGPIAVWLGVAEPDPKGVLIIGANHIAQALAKALKREGFRPLLVDSSWSKISKARMEGLETYFGEPVSEHAERSLDLVGIGNMLALSARGPLNTAACMHYRMELGYNSVFALQTTATGDLTEERKASSHRRGHLLFNRDVTYSSLAGLFGKHWNLRKTGLTDVFDYGAYLDRYNGRIIPMFAITPRGKLRVFSADLVVAPQAGWSVISLVPPDDSESGLGGRE
ncbi:MAG: cation:proton antiporter [Proteobacteria bacterium]|nr:cation:proton antiporter [Pseudomonadota bacterium]MBU1688276.1 cation:proton antiporter [Pseudomonadota bacterium]